jgi:hypothetical protein
MREVAQSHDLREELEAARDHGLGGNDCCEDCYHQRWVERSRRYRVEKRVRVSSSRHITADIRGLADICKEETRVRKADPRYLNRPRGRRKLIRVPQDGVSNIPSAKRTEVRK